MANTIADILNTWNDVGVFSYLIPFLLVFAVVFGVLERTKLFSGGEGGRKNKTLEAIISAAIGLLSLQLDIVPIFFQEIFPRFGFGIAIFITLLIFIGFFYDPHDKDHKNKLGTFGFIIGIGVVLWAIAEWDKFGTFGSFNGWFYDNFWALIILAAIVGVIIVVSRGDRESGSSSGGGRD